MFIVNKIDKTMSEIETKFTSLFQEMKDKFLKEVSENFDTGPKYFAYILHYYLFTDEIRASVLMGILNKHDNPERYLKEIFKNY